MKPTPAAKPAASGYYWVKMAKMTHDDEGNKGWNWDVPEVSGWNIVYFDSRPMYEDGSGPRSYCLDFSAATVSANG